MPRTKRPTTGSPKRRTRKPKAAITPVVTDDEKALTAKYGHTHQIVPGSLRYAGGRAGWGQKRTVEVECPACADGRRFVATSDLQWANTRYCLACVGAVKKGQRAEKRRARKVAVGPASPAADEA